MKKITLRTAEMKEVLKRAKVLKAHKNMHGLQQTIYISDSGVFQVVDTDKGLTTCFHPEILESEGHGVFCLEVAALQKIVNKIKADTFVLNSEGENAKIVYKNINITLKTLDTEFFPVFESTRSEVPSTIEINVSILKDMLEKTLFSASKDELVRNLNCVLLDFTQRYVRVVTADSYRISVSEKTIDEFSSNSADYPERGYGRITIPLKAAKELYKALKYTKKDTTKMDIFNKFVAIHVNEKCNYNIIVERNTVNYPNYEAVIPNRFQTQITVDRVQTLESVEAAAQLLTIDDSIAFKVNGTIKLISSTGTGEFFEALLKGTKEGGDIMAAYDPKFLIEALKQFDTDNIILSMVDSENALQMHAPENDGFITIAMPIKLKREVLERFKKETLAEKK